MTDFRSKKDGSHYPISGGKKAYPDAPMGAEDTNGDMIKVGDIVRAIDDLYDYSGSDKPYIRAGEQLIVDHIHKDGQLTFVGHSDYNTFESQNFELTPKSTDFRMKPAPEFILGKRVVYKTPMFGKYAGKRTMMLEVDAEKGVYMTVPQYRKHLKE